MRGMLQLRNTPDPECKLSPAQVLFGRPLRDAFSFLNRCPKFKNPAIQPIWREAWAAKEDALRTRFARSVEKLNSHARQLPKLQAGERVFIQIQNGPHPNKWDRSGVVLEPLGYDQYSVKVDGTGRVTKRNRRFLRHYTLPATTPMPPAPVHHPDNVPTNAPGAPDMSLASVPACTLQASKNMPRSAEESTPGSTLLHTPVHTSMLMPVDMAVPTTMHTPVSVSAPATAHTAARRGPGRPPKRQHFNFMPKEPVQQSSSSPLPSVPQSSSTPPSSSSQMPPSTAPPSASLQPSLQSRPRRIRCHVKTYDASTGKWS